MFVSVIIPSADRVSIRNCLDALFEAINLVPFEVEVIVSDDSRTGIVSTLIESEYKWVNYVEGPKRGPAANRNNGALFAKGEWLIFLDDDVIPSNQLLFAYEIDIKKYPSSLAFEGAIHTKDVLLLYNDLAHAPINYDGGCFWSANICIKREFFYKIGGFCELFRFAANEDQEIYERIKKHTIIVFCKDAIVWHDVRIDSFAGRLRKILPFNHSWMLYRISTRMSFGEIFIEGLITQISAAKQSFYKRHFRSFLLATITLNVCLFFFLPNWVFSKRKVLNYKKRLFSS